MKCVSCDIEINPKWKHAIEINICPFCGNSIMEEHLKNLFHSLSETMVQLTTYQSQLNDWMLSNHNYIKVDDLQNLKTLQKEVEEKDFQQRKNKKFKVKVATESGGEEEIVAEKIQSEKETNDFFKRAEAVKPNIDGFNSTEEKTAYLKQMVQKIKRDGSPMINQINTTSMINPEMMEIVDSEQVAELQTAIEGENINSALIRQDSYEEEIPAAVLAMANSAKGNNKNIQADLRKLQQLQNKVSDSQQKFLNGAGGFKR